MTIERAKLSVGRLPFGVGIQAGVVPAASAVHKFGHNPAIAAGAEETIWDGADLYVQPTTTPHFISSSAVADTEIIQVEGLDENWAPKSEAYTLAGRVKTAIGNWARVFRACSTSPVALTGDVYVYEDDTITLGVPDTAAKITAKIVLGEEQTLMVVYTIPASKTGYLVKAYFAPDTAQVSTMRLMVREFGMGYRVCDRIVVPGGGPSWQYGYPVPIALPAKADIEMRGDLAAGAGVVSGSLDILLLDD